MSLPAAPEADDGPPLAPLRAYPTLAAAREAALALAARSWVFEIDRTGRGWTLLVEAAQHAAAQEELALFDAELREPRPLPVPRVFSKFSPASLLLAGSLLGAIFLLQDRAQLDLLRLGDADSQALLERGEWWRCFTALTLHADLAHIAANLATGAVFAGFLLPQLGAGLTWALVLLSGGLGNALNSWGYRGGGHHSIGASTAVFAALGLLVAGETWHRWRDPAERSRGRLLLPLGAGLALLAFLGVGEKHEGIDFMAHAWGLVAGVLLGLPAAALRLRDRTGARGQWLAGLSALALLALAWWLALAHAAPASA